MELLKKLRISRRFALRGAVGGIGVSLWLPILESMCNDHGTAFAQGEPIPTSFGIFFRGNGYHPPDWRPDRRLGAPHEPAGLLRVEGRHDVHHRPADDGRRVQGGRMGRRVRARRRRRHAVHADQRHREDARAFVRAIRGDSVPAHDRSNHRGRRPHERAIQVDRDRRAAVRGRRQHGHGSFEPRASRPQRLPATRTRSDETLQYRCSKRISPARPGCRRISPARPGCRRTSRTRSGGACSTACSRTRTA